VSESTPIKHLTKNVEPQRITASLPSPPMPAKYTLLVCALLIAGCAENQAHGAPPLTPSTNDEQLCKAQSWPRALPQVTGLDLAQAGEGALLCFDGLRALAPDGHDVMNDKGPAGDVPWTIKAMNPPAGTRVNQRDPVTLTLGPGADITAPASHPCDWVSTDKIASILGASSATAVPTGDQAGSVDQSCSYDSGSGMVTTELKSPGSFAVDAQSELNVLAANGHGSELNGLPGRAYCTVITDGGKTSSQLMVLLSGGRAYQELGWNGQSCEILKQVAQAALAHIPA